MSLSSLLVLSAAQWLEKDGKATDGSVDLHFATVLLGLTPSVGKYQKALQITGVALCVKQLEIKVYIKISNVAVNANQVFREGEKTRSVLPIE